MRSLVLTDWKSINHDQRCERSRELLANPEVLCGASVGLTLDEHCFGWLWTVCCQYPTETTIEQICFAENPKPSYYGPGVPQYCQQYNHHWSLRVRGAYGQTFVRTIRQFRAHEAQGDPVESGGYLDGGITNLIVSDPEVGSYAACITTGDVYSSGVEGIEIEERLHRLCKRSRNSFRRRAMVTSILGMITRKFAT